VNKTNAASNFTEHVEARKGRSLTPEELERVLDAFAESSSVEDIALATSIPKTSIRRALEDPATAVRAMDRKRGVVGVWMMGKVIDSLQNIIEEASAPNHVLKAVEMLNDMLPSPKAEEAAKEKARPQSIEDALDSL
jgi:hypothetical protein